MEVTPDQAERVSVATRIGRLSLAVLSADSPKTTTTVGGSKTTTWASDVSPALGTDVAQGARAELHVFEGAADGKEFRF
jgi:pilus assembly protein CpaB